MFPWAVLQGLSGKGVLLGCRHCKGANAPGVLEQTRLPPSFKIMSLAIREDPSPGKAIGFG